MRVDVKFNRTEIQEQNEKLNNIEQQITVRADTKVLVFVVKKDPTSSLTT